MNASRKLPLLVIPSTVAILAFALWLGKSSGNASAAPPLSSVINQAVVSIQNGQAAPVTDLVVDAMEVTQSVQDLNNTVPLVMGKRTFVRVYAHSTSGTYPTTAVLRVQIGGFNTTLLPIKPGGPSINVRQTYNRLLPSHAFLFELPTFYTFSNQVTLTAEVNPELIWHPRNPEETTYANNTITKTVSFNEVPPFYLVVASQPYIINNTTYTPSIWDQWNLADWIKRAYPINQLHVYFRTLPTLNATRTLDKYGNWVLVYPNCSVLNNYLAFQRASVLGSPFYPDDTAFYAMVSDTAGFMRGCSPIGGYFLNFNARARVASGPSGSDSYGWDVDGTYADWYGGHELGHAFGLSHVRGGPGYVKDGCGGEAGSWTEYPDGRISPTLNFWAPTAMFGFDYRQLYLSLNPVLSPFWHDMMTYCDYQWISGFTYLELENGFKSILSQDQAAKPAPTAVQDVLAIFGALNLSTGQLTLQPTSILYSVPDVIPPTPGNYAIVLRNADGSELARYPFSLQGLGPGQSPDPSQETQFAYISELVPYVAGTTTIQIEGPGGVLLAQVNAGIDPPTVLVTSPVGGTVEEGATVTVTWTASDPDGDPLTFNVDYSSDNGTTWDTVGQFYTGTQAIIDQTNLPASEQARVRVWASDGINTIRSTTDAFTIPNHIPTGQIIEPATDITVAVSQTVTFEGQVYDVELGTLDGTNIQWSSSIDGFLGNGAIFNTDSLSVGVHVISMSADDGLGGVLTDSVTVTVVPTPNDLPAQPDALTAGPDPVFIQPASGIVTATVYVDNLNLGNAITWDAAVDQPWLLLSDTSGTTPQDLTVSTSLAPNDFGTHTATIIFTSPQAPGTRVIVRVVVTLPKYDLYLPVTLR
jgi:Putative binding domain, N-terminal